MTSIHYVKPFCQTFSKTASAPSKKPLHRRSQSRSRFWRSRSPAKQVLRACLAGLRLHQTHSGAAGLPICSYTVELNSPFGAEEICLSEITTPTSRNKSLDRLPSFGPIFFIPVHWCVVRVRCTCMRLTVLCLHACCCAALCLCACAVFVCLRVFVRVRGGVPACVCAYCRVVLMCVCCACVRVLCLPACVCLYLCACFAVRVALLARPAALLPRPARPPCRIAGCRTRPCPG
jgi:hypothetical protein